MASVFAYEFHLPTRKPLESKLLPRASMRLTGSKNGFVPLFLLSCTRQNFALDAARTVADMDMPGFRLHVLKGEMKGFWTVIVRANWRVIFRFDDGAEDVDYVDHH